VACARQSGKPAAGAEPVREFAGMLGAPDQEEGSFLNKVLESAIGKSQSQEVLRQVKRTILARDPFSQIRNAEVKEIAKALQGESAQVVAIVLSELPAKKSPALLLHLDEKIRRQAVSDMTSGEEAPAEVRLRVAEAIRARLDAMGGQEQKSSGDGDERREAQYRKVAVLLRGLEVPLRDILLQSIGEKGKEGSERILKLMVIWEDLPAVADRAMQEILRTIDSRKLALALVNTPDDVKTKIRSNMSERASAMLEEEASLLSSPKPDDIRAAREAVLDTLRTLNAKGELAFQET
jgi:flagellar motor switch protein FliG